MCMIIPKTAFFLPSPKHTYRYMYMHFLSISHAHTYVHSHTRKHTHTPSPPGSGWTTKETVRSLAYSILADLVHHIRTSLSLQHLSMAVFLFSKNVHDETLPVSIQTMSCKLLLNLVECIRQKAETEPAVSSQGKCTVKMENT